MAAVMQCSRKPEVTLRSMLILLAQLNETLVRIAGHKETLSVMIHLKWVAAEWHI